MTPQKGLAKEGEAEARGSRAATRWRIFERLTEGSAGGHPAGDRNEKRALNVRRDTETSDRMFEHGE